MRGGSIRGEGRQCQGGRGGSNYDSLLHARRVSGPSSLLDLRGHGPPRIQCPMSILTSGPETWPWGPVGWRRSSHDRVSRVPLVNPVLAQSWSQTATDGAWYSTTALLSGRDRPRCLCVLRLSGSEPKTRRTGA